MTDWEKVARNAARRHGIDEDNFVRQMMAESGLNPSAGLTSSAGAIGIAQIMPATARGWGVDPHDPRASLNAAARAMGKYIDSYGGWRNALVAYNAGPGRVGKPLYGETSRYIDKVLVPGAATDGVSRRPGRGRAQAQAAPESGMSPSSLAALKFVMQGSPLYESTVKAATPIKAPGGKEQKDTVPAKVPDAGKAFSGKKGWQTIQRIGQRRFGLENDPGDNQTTGGSHTADSRHYAGMAVDFGSGRNSREDLERWYAWALRNRGKYGFSEVLYEDKGTGNEHVHVAF